MIFLIAGLVLFLGIHSVRMAAPGFRDGVMAARGEGAWKGLYSLVALAGLVLTVWGYGQARPGALLWEPPAFLAHVNLLLMWPALILLVASQFPAGRIKKAVKHPMLLSVKIWAFGHLLANGELAAIVLFGAFLVWAILNRIAVKRRGDPVFATVSVRNDILSVVIGTALYLWILLQGHAWLIGVPVLPA